MTNLVEREKSGPCHACGEVCTPQTRRTLIFEFRYNGLETIDHTHHWVIALCPACYRTLRRAKCGDPNWGFMLLSMAERVAVAERGLAPEPSPQTPSETPNGADLDRGSYLVTGDSLKQRWIAGKRFNRCDICGTSYPLGESHFLAGHLRLELRERDLRYRWHLTCCPTCFQVWEREGWQVRLADLLEVISLMGREKFRAKLSAMALGRVLGGSSLDLFL